MQHTTIAVDHAKSVFQVAVSHQTGRVDEEHRLSRARFVAFFAARPAATVLLEACGSAHHWARTLEQLGHTVRLLPPHETRPYVRRNKTDRTDAKALLEAARNEEIHLVPVKSVTQQAVASLHRVRTAWVRTRTARLNTLRGLLREFGLTIPVGARQVVPHVRALVEDPDAPVPTGLRPSLEALCEEIRGLEQRIRDLERQREHAKLWGGWQPAVSVETSTIAKRCPAKRTVVARPHNFACSPHGTSRECFSQTSTDRRGRSPMPTWAGPPSVSGSSGPLAPDSLPKDGRPWTRRP